MLRKHNVDNRKNLRETWRFQAPEELFTNEQMLDTLKTHLIKANLLDSVQVSYVQKKEDGSYQVYSSHLNWKKEWDVKQILPSEKNSIFVNGQVVALDNEFTQDTNTMILVSVEGSLHDQEKLSEVKNSIISRVLSSSPIEQSGNDEKNSNQKIKNYFKNYLYKDNKKGKVEISTKEDDGTFIHCIEKTKKTENENRDRLKIVKEKKLTMENDEYILYSKTEKTKTISIFYKTNEDNEELGQEDNNHLDALYEKLNNF